VSRWLEQAVEEGRAALNSLRTASRPRPADLQGALQRAHAEADADGAGRVSRRIVGTPRELHPIVGDEIASIGREAIRNAWAHSGGSHLDVDIVCDSTLTLRVRDDGAGIDLSTSVQGREGHFGIPGMRERAASIGGRLTFA